MVECFVLLIWLVFGLGTFGYLLPTLEKDMSGTPQDQQGGVVVFLFVVCVVLGPLMTLICLAYKWGKGKE